MIIGVTGSYCAGKDTVAEILVKKGFYHISLSDMIRDELKKQRKALTRKNFQDLGNHLRGLHGPGILAQLAFQKMKPDKNYVVTSIRNPGEVKVFSPRKDFVLVNVDAPVDVRFERLLNSGRKALVKDQAIQTIQDFKKNEKIERSSHASELQLHKVAKMAKITLINNYHIDMLTHKINKFLSVWMPKLQIPRPNWDEYFMQITRTVSSRSNCIKRKVAAIVVKDKRIISTGYNGTPRGARNCNEGGCKKCNSYTSAENRLDKCVCSHGEESAIVQAAYHGVSLKRATLYTTYSICVWCTRMIINSGIKEVVSNQEYPLVDSVKNLFKEAKVKTRQHRMKA